MNRSLEREVRERAGERCEYCRLPASRSDFRFPIDHIIARKHRGATTADNLALSCQRCNVHKGSDLAGLDPITGRLTRLFNPRRNRWRAHFALEGPLLVGRTAIGRTTVEVLDMNYPDRVELRKVLIEAGIYEL